MEMISIGCRIQKRRKELDLTLKELSEKCGILPQLISDYENDRKEPGIKNLKALCQALEVYPNYLLSDNTSFSNQKTRTYGEILDYYFKALELSKKDELVVNRENGTVLIYIKDPIIKNVFIQIEDFLEMGGDYAKTMKDFNVNTFSEIEIKD